MMHTIEWQFVQIYNVFEHFRGGAEDCINYLKIKWSLAELKIQIYIMDLWLTQFFPEFYYFTKGQNFHGNWRNKEGFFYNVICNVKM